MFAIVIFGSQVSGGSDCKSDHDLLIVCEGVNKRHLIEKYSKLGYSVSAYTPRQLEFMKEKGSLFIQHLKSESKIIFDEAGEFKRFIENCPFMRPTMKEIYQSRERILNVIQSPRELSLLGWKADYLFVLSRDYFIKHFARNKNIVFNTKKLAKAISNEFNLKIDEVNTFLLLREYKSNYRNGELNQYSIENDINAWIITLSKILNITKWSTHKREGYINFLEHNVFKSTYDLLRYIESLKILFPDISLSSDMEERVQKLITYPNHYSSSSASSKSYLINYLKEFRARANESKLAYLEKQ